MFFEGFLSLTVVHFLLLMKTIATLTIVKEQKIRERSQSKMDHAADSSGDSYEESLSQIDRKIREDRIDSTIVNNFFMIEKEVKRRTSPEVEQWPERTGSSSRKKLTRIVREIAKDTVDFPYIINILRIDRGNYYVHCAASFVSPLFLLTAAHCSYHPITGSHLPVHRLVAIYISRQDDGTNVVTVKRIHRHKCYRAHSLHNDIALLRIESTLPPYKVISLPTKLDESLEVLRPVLTFARTSTVKGFKTLSNALQTVNIPYVTLAECRAAYEKLNFNMGLIVDRMHLCGGGLYEMAPCKGDSGGPIIANGIQVGLISWAAGCGIENVPDVFIRIDTYMPWILKVVNEEEEGDN